MLYRIKRRILVAALGIGLGYSSATFAFSLGELFGFGRSDESNPQQAAAEKTQSANQPVDSMEQQIKQIDQEILILRAELALKNGDISQLQQQINQLEASGVLPLFVERVAQLKTHLEQGKSKPSLFEFLGLTGTRFDVDLTDPNAVVAIVLPMSGDYQRVGSSLSLGIESALKKQGFKGQIYHFDTEQYGNLYLLWERLKNFQPNLIFGPLKKLNIQAWHDLQTGVPTLYLNDAPINYQSYEKSLSPSRSGGMLKSVDYLHKNFYKGALLLAQDDERAALLLDEFNALNNQQAKSMPYAVQRIETSVDDGIEKGLGIEESKARAAVLRKRIARTIEFVPRSRQDLDAVLSLLPANQAVQVAPFLNLYQLSHVKHLWFAPQVPKLTDLTLYQTAWQETYAFLPTYLYQSYQQEVNLRPQAESGIFNALGTAAVEILTFSDQFDQRDWLINTSVGQVETRPTGQFYLLPAVYFLNNAKVVPVNTD
ncbi:penicillin-binding protein activator [Thiosulfatimonas sediminis]|nr:penicillin-binding protein activator [Thiosulfatimonas sediminis]